MELTLTILLLEVDFGSMGAIKHRVLKEASLHDDLLIQILLLLPTKSVIRFMCVSKSWYSLITSSTFVKLYDRSNGYNNRALLRGYSAVDEFPKHKLCHENHNLEEISVVEFAVVRSFPHNFKIMGCAHGLICLSGYHSNGLASLIIWNPTIRRMLTIPESELDSNSIVGFGFDSVNDDYKIVKIVSDFDHDKTSTEIFSLKTRCWKMISRSDSVSFLIHQPVDLNCKLYLLTWDKFIIGFDLSNEVFGEKIMLPISLRPGFVSVPNLSVAVWRGFLSVFESVVYMNVNWWVMKEEGVSESWVKQFVIDESLGLVQGVISNGNVILHTKQAKLVLYNPESNQFEQIDKHEDIKYGLDIVSYVESLILLDEADASPDIRVLLT